MKLKEMKVPKLYMNLSSPKLINKHKNLPIEGIGLFRIEFMIATFIGQHPAWLIAQDKSNVYYEKLMESISIVSEAIYPKPVVIRFSDFKTNEYRSLAGGSNYEPQESNPMMGLRGAARFISEKFQGIFRIECEAILKLREKWDNVWVMIPFVRTVPEARRCLEIMKEEGLTRSPTFKIWLMAETPSNAFLIEEFNTLDIDGYSIGSNDLCQFILAVDRDNSDLMQMGYSDPEDPALLKALEMIIKGAHKDNKTCSICGEAVSKCLGLIDRLMELDIDSISVNPSEVLKIRDYLDKKR